MQQQQQQNEYPKSYVKGEYNNYDNDNDQSNDDDDSGGCNGNGGSSSNSRGDVDDQQQINQCANGERYSSKKKICNADTNYVCVCLCVWARVWKNAKGTKFSHIEEVESNARQNKLRKKIQAAAFISQ